MRILQMIAGLALTAALAACGGSNGTDAPDTSNSSASESSSSSSNNNSSGHDTDSPPENAIVELRFDSNGIQIPRHTTTTLTLSAVMEDGTTESLDDGVEYTVGDEGLASYDVSGESIRLLGLEEGTTFFSASYDNISVSVDVEVTSPVVASLNLSGESELALGESLEIIVEATYEGDVIKNVTESAEFTVGDEGVLAKDAEQNEKFSTESVGTTTVTVIYGGISETHFVEVLPAVLQGIDLSPPAAEITQGESLQFNMTGSYSDGSEKDITSQTEWSVDTESVGSFSTETPGLFESKGSGDAVIYGAIGNLMAGADLYVEADPNGPASVTISASPNVLLAGSADLSEVGVTVVPNDSEGTTPDGTEVLVSKGDSEEYETYQTLDGRFTLEIDAPSDGGDYSVSAQVADSTAQGSINIQVVESFSSVLSTSRSSSVSKTNNFYNAGSQFSATVSNTSNREFVIIGAEMLNGDDVRDTYLATSYPEIFNDGVLLGGEAVGLSITLNNSLEDNGVAIRFDFEDEATGSSFSKTVEFNSSFNFF